MRSVLVKVILFAAVLGLIAKSTAAETLTLNDCIELALKNRANMIIARGNEKLAGANKLWAFGQFLPNVRGSYTHTKSNEYNIDPPSGLTSKDTIFTTIIGTDTAKDAGRIATSFTDKQDIGPNKTLRLDASMDVVNLSTWFNYFGSSSSSSAAHLATIDTEQELILAVKTAYYNYLRAVQNEEVNRQAVERGKEQLKLVESRYELGSAAYSDVLGQRVLYGNDRLEHLRAQNSVTTSKASLSYTVGIDPFGEVEYSTVEASREFDGTMQEAIQFGLDHEPGYLASVADVSARKHAVSSTVADYIPVLSIFGSYSDFKGTQAFPQAFEYSSKTKTFGFQISYSIFDGFGRQREISRAKINRNNAMATMSDTRNLVVQQIKTAYLDIENQKEALAVASEAVASAEENMKIVQERYDLGAATILDLLQAQEDLKRAQVSSINERFSLNLSIAQLENAMGKP